MTSHLHRQRPAGEAHIARLYSPDLQSLLQSLLATLADLDFAYESDLEVVKNSATDELLKRLSVEKLERQHCERRALYLRQLVALQEQMLIAAA
jgi:hypothetical protein